MDNLYIEILILLFTYVNLCFLIAWIKADNSIMDIAWGLGFVVIALWIQYFYPIQNRWIITFFVTVSGLRLSIYLYWRQRGQKEDWRYANWRSSWGKFFRLRSYFQIFILQGFFLFIISLPILTPHKSSDILDLKICIGALIFFIGFLFEAVSDYQLYRFRQNPVRTKRFLTSGLWKYSRHPNYFGQMMIWWGIFLISTSFGEWEIAIISPITMTLLLTKVSGIPMLEEKFKNDPEYQEYKQHTPAFIPNLCTFAANLMPSEKTSI